MNNVHPVFKAALKPWAPAKSAQPFLVSISGKEPLTVLATDSCEAISRAIQVMFDAEETCPPAGLTIHAERLQ